VYVLCVCYNRSTTDCSIRRYKSFSRTTMILSPIYVSVHIWWRHSLVIIYCMMFFIYCLSVGVCLGVHIIQTLLQIMPIAMTYNVKLFVIYWRQELATSCLQDFVVQALSLNRMLMNTVISTNFYTGKLQLSVPSVYNLFTLIMWLTVHECVYCFDDTIYQKC